MLFGDYARKQTAASRECPPVTVPLPGSCRDRVARWEPISPWDQTLRSPGTATDELFGPGGVGSFTITNYRNGYFWGSGSGPAGTLGESFTQLGSITPEGNVLFNVLTGQSVPTLLTLTGQITDKPLTARMALRTYEFSGSDPAFGAVGYAVIVPEPPT